MKEILVNQFVGFQFGNQRLFVNKSTFVKCEGGIELSPGYRDILSYRILLSQTDKFVDVLHQPLTALCVQDLIMVSKIVKYAIATQNLGRLCTADSLFRLVLLYTERKEIGYVLVSLAH